MARLSDSFASGYLNNRLLDAVKALNNVNDALAHDEVELRMKVNDIINQILTIEV